MPNKKINLINNMSVEDYKKIDELNKKLRENPNNMELLMQKAFVYSDGYDDQNAIKTYKKIIRLYPNNLDAYFWLSYYMYQIALMLSDAIKLAKKGLEINPNRADLYLVIAWTLNFMGRNDKEYLYNIKKAIELEPTWISPRISLIEFLRDNKQYEEAKNEISKALKQIDDNFEIPSNDIQYQYEYYITGRTRSKNKQVLQKLLNEIEIKENKKINLSNNNMSGED